jgi:hypothetical protein
MSPGKQMNRMRQFLFVFFLLVLTGFGPDHPAPQEFRQSVLDYARALASRVETASEPQAPLFLRLGGSWEVLFRAYLGGNVLTEGTAAAERLEQALKGAVTSALAKTPPADLNAARFFISLHSWPGTASLVEYQGKACEVAADRVAIRNLSPELIASKIRDQREYLLRQIHPEYHAFFKLYDAKNDVTETRLRTIYTASSLWTFLQMDRFEKDERLENLVRPMADYLLSMQVKSGRHAGAFHYSFDPLKKEKQDRFVVGTSAKTIFTLLKLYELTKEAPYLDAARLAGTWLAGQTQADGQVFPVVKRNAKGKWVQLKKQSFLYSGQTLSALSRLAVATGEGPYKEAASRIAERLLSLAQAADYFVGDGYREPNTVSTSWLVMSLLDYARLAPQPRLEQVISLAVKRLLERQMKDPGDRVRWGLYGDRFTSGNGWVNEVMVEVVRHCRAVGGTGCEEYENALLLSTRWLAQNFYSLENAYAIPNPARALGGAIRSPNDPSVRTDAVCHGANGFIGVLDLLESRASLSAPDELFSDSR